MKNSYTNTIKCFVISLLLVPASLGLAVEKPEVLPATALIKALQSGGHIIYMRHGETDVTQRDTNRDSFDDCTEQRNLTDEGRRHLQVIGQTIRALKIPIGQVTSSPYCRTRDTAKITFGDFEIDENLQFSISKNKVEAKQLGNHLLTMMVESEADEMNEVIVGHTANLKDGLGVWPKPEGAMAVFKKIEGKIIFKGLIAPDAWNDE